MRLLFVYDVVRDQGSAQDIRGYAAAARALGHEVVLHGPPRTDGPFPCSLDVEAVDAAVFVMEWGVFLHHGGPLNLVRLLAHVPRARRVVIDCDGNYNEPIGVVGDRNHRDAAASRHRLAVYDALADKVYQPTLHPLRPNVGTFLFHAYDPAWEAPLDFRGKAFGMAYVGNVWFRWRPLRRVLRALEPIRPRTGRIALVGHGWLERADWASRRLHPAAYRTDPAYLRRLGVEVFPPCPFYEAIAWMGRAVFNPVLYRPLFDRLGLVTCRTFETPAAATIPLFGQAPAFVEAIYGPPARELVLGPKAADATALLADVLERPAHYAARVRALRRRLAAEHSYAARLRQLLAIIRA
ncbi:MAG TPA: glycosyltransferase [Candidatus Thermoplasmatota archaeon]|nr:glycosyltransferase [Candidatus Thermoplasmatota archaeon]